MFQNPFTVGLVFVCSMSVPALGQQPVAYALDADSLVTGDFCLGPCDCGFGPFTGRLSGTFTLVFDHVDPLFAVYRVEEVQFIGDLTDFRELRFTGGGTYRIGGEVALLHQLELRLDETGVIYPFDSGLVVVDGDRPFPRIGITAQSELMGCTQFTFDFFRATPSGCGADLNGDWEVGLADLSILLSNFGTLQGATHDDGDLDGDGDVDLGDLASLLAGFGTRCV
jgi:hypothetical protein